MQTVRAMLTAQTRMTLPTSRPSASRGLTSSLTVATGYTAGSHHVSSVCAQQHIVQFLSDAWYSLSSCCGMHAGVLLLSTVANFVMAGTLTDSALHACGMLWLVSKVVAARHGGVTWKGYEGLHGAAGAHPMGKFALTLIRLSGIHYGDCACSGAYNGYLVSAHEVEPLP